jgi:hypothetical protein
LLTALGPRAHRHTSSRALKRKRTKLTSALKGRPLNYATLEVDDYVYIDSLMQTVQHPPFGRDDMKTPLPRRS